MISIVGLSGFWILALLTLHGADVGETKRNSLNEPDVPFPPACPTAENLAAVCLQGQGRPRYLSSFFPNSRVSHFHRRGNAINRMESWFSLCCRGQQDQNHTSCECWKQALSQFCTEEASTMTKAYVCCADRGEARWTCFNSELPNPYYDPTPGYTAPPVPEEAGFTFDPNDC
ncbi:hypothetical protein F7725_025277 [Dissostichus mawsoni]|uniref:Extracellular matrix protein 1 n=1 Tax=Dissostichus mawsoni TaxID=36200 RepID=A0A7J5XB57_DISMA|nr:hypothetical protein F7725_025277 [Dissostichus mawsoni]